MRKRVMSGILAVVCAAMILGTGVSMAPMQEVQAEEPEPTLEDQLQEEKNNAKASFQDWKINNLKENDNRTGKIDEIIIAAESKIDRLTTIEGVQECRDNAILEMNNIVNPPSDNTDEEEEEEPAPANADHFLMVGGNWVTPVANAGQTVSIVLPVVNMGKTMVTDAVVTPVLSTDTAVWPFEITSSSYSQTISDLPGTDTGASDMDRRRELTWNLQTRTDVGTGYQKISFDVRYRDSQGNSQSTTLDTYIQVNGTAGVGADGQASVPRVIVTGFDTNPAEVHAGESFTLTLHLKNTSTATSVNNMICEIVAAVEGKDEETTYAAFLPTAGSSTIFVDKIEKNGTKDISLELEAKADLSQKPYAVDVNMSYEDEKVNSYTNKTSVSIPVKQEARVEVSEPEVMPASIEVGGESNVMFNIYNMGKTKLYNVQVKTVSDFLSGGDAFIGNLDSGATGAVDIYLMGQAATTDDGMVTLQISYEDETGETTTIEREISLFVSETSYDDMIYDDSMMMDDMNQNQGGSTMRTILIVAGILLLIAVIAVVVILRRRKKKEQKSLEDDILDLDQEEEGEDDEIS